MLINLGSEMPQAPSARLADIETALERHFQELSTSKHRNGSLTPTFAIEHGLDGDTVASLGARLGSSLGDLRERSNAQRRTSW